MFSPVLHTSVSLTLTRTLRVSFQEFAHGVTDTLTSPRCLLNHRAEVKQGHLACGIDADDIGAVDESAVEGFRAKARLARDGPS